MQIDVAIASTTHVDLHGERMAISTLKTFAKQIRSKFIPTLIEHDPKRQIGVLLYGKVAGLEDGESALYVVIGFFENEKERDIYRNNFPNKIWRNYVKYLKGIKPKNNPLLSNNRQQSKSFLKEQTIEELLESHLNSTQVWKDGRVYKIKRFIASIGDLKIQVYPKDHLPAHFHVLSKQRGIDARFDVKTLQLISVKKGTIQRDDIKKIKNFFEINPGQLKKLEEESLRFSI